MYAYIIFLNNFYCHYHNFLTCITCMLTCTFITSYFINTVIFIHPDNQVHSTHTAVTFDLERTYTHMVHKWNCPKLSTQQDNADILWCHLILTVISIITIVMSASAPSDTLMSMPTKSPPVRNNTHNTACVRRELILNWRHPTVVVRGVPRDLSSALTGGELSTDRRT